MNGRCTVSLRWLITPGMGAPWPCTRAGSYGCHQAPTHQRSLGLTRELRVGSPDPPRARWPSHDGQQPVAPELVGGRDEGPRRAAAASREVCAGRMTLEQAQHDMLATWGPR